jgi:transglutaminase-like putative cysteine protease
MKIWGSPTPQASALALSALLYGVGGSMLFAASDAFAAEPLAKSASAADGLAVHVRDGVRFETGSEPAFVVRRELPERWDPQAPGADDPRWRHWRYEIQADRRAGRDLVYHEHAYEAKTPSLVSEAGKFQITFNPEFQRLTLHRVELQRDGRWQDRLVPDKISLARREREFEQDLTDGSVTALIVLEDVRVDDIVRIGYTVAGSNPIMGGQTTDGIVFGWRNPLLESGLRVLYDPGTDFALYRENTRIEPKVRRGADAVEVTLRAERSPAIIDEDTYPVWYQPYPMAEIAEKRRWADVVAWALPLYPQQRDEHESQPFDADLERRIAEWRKLRTPAERLTAALRAVQNDVRYFGVEIGDSTHRPNPPHQVWRNRYGDCKDKVYLLTTILRRLDIDAVPALVSTERGRAIADFVPSASVFNHVIVRARIAGETVWVDPTIAQQGGDPRRFDLSDYGMALPIVAGVDALEPIAAPRESNAGVEVFERFVPAADGASVAFNVETVYTGSSADYQRRSTLGERGEDLSRRYAEYYRKRYGELEVLELPKLEDDPERNVLRVHERYRLKAPFQTEAGGVRALDAYAEALQAASTLPTSVDRRGPLDYVARGRYRHEISVQLPERWQPTFRPERADYASPAFRFERKVEVEDETVRLVYDMNVQSSEIAADQVAGHLQQLRKVRDDISASLRFNIPASLDGAQRQQRLRDLLNKVIDGDKTP